MTPPGCNPLMMKRSVAEFLGTGVLVSVVVGSGAMAQNLTHNVGLQLLINAVATILALGLLIELFASISGSHFNPVVSAIQVIRGELSPKDFLLYVIAQTSGGILGAMTSNLMFSHPAVFISHHERTGLHLWLGEVVATAVQAMSEVGIDIANQQPKILTTEAVLESDAVITMGCGDACPFYPGKRNEDWVLEDPAGQDIDFVRKVRDDIKGRVEQLLSELLA